MTWQAKAALSPKASLGYEPGSLAWELGVQRICLENPGASRAFSFITVHQKSEGAGRAGDKGHPIKPSIRNERRQVSASKPTSHSPAHLPRGNASPPAKVRHFTVPSKQNKKIRYHRAKGRVHHWAREPVMGHKGSRCQEAGRNIRGFLRHLMGLKYLERASEGDHCLPFSF